MRCEDGSKRIQAYVDGQLSLQEAQFVEAHVTRCPACQKDLALLRQVDEALSTLPLLEEPADFTAQVMAQVRATEPVGHRSRPVPLMTKAPGQAPPVSLPAFRLRWEDAAVSFAFAGAATMVLLALSMLGPEQVSAARASLERAWWTLLPELDRLWRTVQMEPAYAVWALSSLCLAATAAASAIVLLRQWSGRSISWRRRQRVG